MLSEVNASAWIQNLSIRRSDSLFKFPYEYETALMHKLSDSIHLIVLE